MHLAGWVNTLLSLKHVTGHNTILGSTMCNEYPAEKQNFFCLFCLFFSEQFQKEEKTGFTGIFGVSW